MRDVHPPILPAMARPHAGRLQRIAAGLAVLLSAAPAQALLRYELDYMPVSESMQVRICSDVPRRQQDLRLHRGAANYVSDITRELGSVEKTGEARWSVRDWKAGECVSYAAALGRIARSGDRDIGRVVAADLLAAPQQWLMLGATDEEAQLRVRMPPGYAFSPPWQMLDRDATGVARYRLPSTPFSWSALVAVGQFEEIELARAGGTVRLAILGQATAEQRRMLQTWITHALDAVATGHGRLPLPYAQVVLIAGAGAGRGDAVGFGQSLRGQGNAVHVWVDATHSLQELDADWTAVHEFSHWAHPYLGEDGAWLSEGLASYWQNVLRGRAGLLTPQQAWQQLDAGFGRGRRTAVAKLSLAELSAAMHERRAYYAVYWSGAAYWLQVDVELRRASGGARSVDLALRRFRDCCLQRRREWEPAEFVAKLDELLGSEVFVPRWREYSARRGFPPLEATYAALGLQQGGDGKLQLVDAPESALRDAIMRARSPAK